MKKENSVLPDMEALVEFESQLRHREHLVEQREIAVAARERALHDAPPPSPTNPTSSSSRLTKTVVFGALDGVTTTFALVCSAVAVGDHDIPVTNIFVLGLANLLADGFSMGMGDYLSTIAEHDDGGPLPTSEVAKRRNLDAARSGVIMFGSFVFFGGIPLFAFLPLLARGVRDRFHMACVLCAMSLFFLGVLKGRLSHTRTSILTGVVMMFTGGLASVLSYSVSAGAHSMFQQDL